MNVDPAFESEMLALQDLLERKNFQEFAARAGEAIARYPGHAPLHGLLGFALIRLGRPAEAERQLREAIARDPAYADAAQNLVVALTVQRKAGEALQWLHRLESLDPARAATPQLLCNILFISGTYDAGLTEKALRGAYRAFFAQLPDFEIRTARCVTSAEWQKGAQSVTYVLDASQQVSLSDAATGQQHRYQLKEVAAITVPGGRMVGNWDYVLTATGELLSDSGYQPIEVPFVSMPHQFFETLRLVAYPSLPDIVEVDADALFLSGANFHQVGHFIIDILPRLRAWKAGERAMKVAIPQNLPSYHRAMLAGFGVTEADLVECRLACEYQFKSLTFYRALEPQLRNPHAVRFTYAHITARAPAPKRAPGRRLYLERSGTPRGRDIANDAEFKSVLAKHGFQTVRRPAMSLEQQNDTFSDASMVAAVFGTDALTIFQLRPLTHVFVFVFEDGDEAMRRYHENFALACAALQMRLHVIACRAAGDAGGYFRDLVVDCDAFEEGLRAAIAG